MYTPGNVEPIGPMVASSGPWGMQLGQFSATQNFTSSANGTANRVYYFPIILPSQCVAKRVWWTNGSAASGNISVAIYTAGTDGNPYAKVAECASTAQGTISQVQFVDWTDVVLPAGAYWLALAFSSGTATSLAVSPNAQIDQTYRFVQESITVGSLPSTATPVETTGSIIWLFGFATTASP